MEVCLIDGYPSYAKSPWPIGATITGQQFGWASTTASMTTGILAAGYGVEITGYYGVIDEMYLEGIINSRVFSLDLGSVDSPYGE